MPKKNPNATEQSDKNANNPVSIRFTTKQKNALLIEAKYLDISISELVKMRLDSETRDKEHIIALQEKLNNFETRLEQVAKNSERLNDTINAAMKEINYIAADWFIVRKKEEDISKQLASIEQATKSIDAMPQKLLPLERAINSLAQTLFSSTDDEKGQTNKH